MNVRNALKSDAKDLAYLINLAGEGIPEYLWKGMAEGNETPIEVGIRRASREEGGFSYTKAKVCTIEDKLAGMCIAYKLDDPYDIGDLNEYPDFLRPLVELESLVPGSWYINAIATNETFRGMGVAQKLLKNTENEALDNNCRQLSLIVSSAKPKALSLYYFLGYKEVSKKPFIPFQENQAKADWILMTKSI